MIALAQQLVDVGLAELMQYGHLRLHPALGPALDRELSEEERDEARRQVGSDLHVGQASLAYFLPPPTIRAAL